jgi:NADH dehydrogenase
MKHIVIIGGGFAGINLANGLAKKEGYHVTLVDRNNYHFFPPLLYQVATGFLEPSNISYPYRKLFRGSRNISFHMGSLKQVDYPQKKVILSSGELSYDYLVFATGAATNFFGMRNVQEHALPMKTLNDALALRNHLLLQLELADSILDKEERQKYLNVVVAGGGPTGVEISGMLADIRKHILQKDYPDSDGLENDINIYLVDGLDAVLKPMSDRSQEYTLASLTSMGVNVKLNMQVKDYTGDVVIFANGETIQTKTLVWAAGVTGSVIDGTGAEYYGRGRRLIVDPYNAVAGMEGVYAIGDCCIQTTDAPFPNGHPQLAQVGIQQGANLARNFLAMEKKKSLKAFAYFDKGSMAIIGRKKAVVDLPGNKAHFNGFIAWFMWLFVHLVSLVSKRNRVTTFYNWSGAYFSKDQSLRMIIRPSTN